MEREDRERDLERGPGGRTRKEDHEEVPGGRTKKGDRESGCYEPSFLGRVVEKQLRRNRGGRLLCARSRVGSAPNQLT